MKKKILNDYLIIYSDLCKNNTEEKNENSWIAAAAVTFLLTKVLNFILSYCDKKFFI